MRAAKGTTALSVEQRVMQCVLFPCALAVVSMGWARSVLLGTAAVCGCCVLLVRGQRRRVPLAAVVAVLSGPGSDGVVCLRQYGPWLIFGGYTKVTGRVTGLFPAGPHGLHILEKGDTREGASSCGAHLNPDGCAHGWPCDAVRHAGDLGNVWSSDGVAVFEFICHLQVSTLAGRALVVTLLPDDGGRGDNSEPWPSTTQGRSSKTTGNAGPAAAFGVLGWAAN